MIKEEPKEQIISSPSPSTEDLEEATGSVRSADGQGGKKKFPSRRFSIIYALAVILAMLITGLVVWAVMDSRTDTSTPTNTDTPISFPEYSPLEMSTDFPLGLCQGDCDRSSDCAEGLVCFQRNEGEEVPGCAGGIEDTSKTDYCISNRKPSLTTSSDFPLGLCQGDCDTNRDCSEGPWMRWRRRGFQQE
jgi:hypothetical protein